MTEKYKPKKGDRVRVVLEGEVSKTHSGGDFDIEGFNFISPWEKHTVSIEKIKPPVEVFKPGDVVRNLTTGNLYAVGDTHAVSLQTGRAYNYRYSNPLSHYTSRLYEKVNLSS